MAHAGFPNGTGQTAEEIINSLKNDTDDIYRLLIIDIDGIAIGEMNYRNKGSGMVEIGIKICDFSKQNKGIGKILLSMLIASLFNEMGYTKIIINTNSNNELILIHGKINLESYNLLLIMNCVKMIS